MGIRWTIMILGLVCVPVQWVSNENWAVNPAASKDDKLGIRDFSMTSGVTKAWNSLGLIFDPCLIPNDAWNGLKLLGMHHVTMFLCDTSARCFAWHPGPGNDRPNLRVSQLQGGDERWKTLMGGMELNKNTEGWWLLMVFHTLFFFWQSVYLIHVHIIFTWHIRSSHCVPLCFPQDSSLVAGSMSSKTRPDLDFVIWIWPFRFRFEKNLATVDRGPFHPRCRQDTQYEYWSSAARWDTQRTMDGSCYDGPE